MAPTLSSDTRAELLEAALLCFAEHGSEAASIRLVASMAGRNSSLISYHFGNKEGLYLEVVRYVLTHFTAPFPKEGLPGVDSRARLHAYITWMIFDRIRAKSSPEPLWFAAKRILFAEILLPRPEVRALLAEHLEAPARELRAILHAISPDLDPEEAACWGFLVQGCCLTPLFADFGSLVWPQQAAPRTQIPASIPDRLTDFVYAGMSPRKGPASASLRSNPKGV